MDDIQRTLIKAGRKDLAKDYYEKITSGYNLGKFIKDLKSLKFDVEEINDKLGTSINSLTKSDRDTHSIFMGRQKDSIELLTFFDHYIVQTLRNLPSFKKKLEAMHKYLPVKIKFLNSRQEQ